MSIENSGILRNSRDWRAQERIRGHLLLLRTIPPPRQKHPSGNHPQIEPSSPTQPTRSEGDSPKGFCPQCPVGMIVWCDFCVCVVLCFRFVLHTTVASAKPLATICADTSSMVFTQCAYRQRKCATAVIYRYYNDSVCERRNCRKEAMRNAVFLYIFRNMQKCEHCLNHLLPPRKNNVIALWPTDHEFLFAIMSYIGVPLLFAVFSTF